MNKEHPIAHPSLELVQQWATQSPVQPSDESWAYELFIVDKAVRFGADQELEACVEWLGDAPVVYNDNGDLHPGSYLRDARRPKPPTLKEQALEQLRALDQHGALDCNTDKIRRALEQLD